MLVAARHHHNEVVADALVETVMHGHAFGHGKVDAGLC